MDLSVVENLINKNVVRISIYAFLDGGIRLKLKTQSNSFLFPPTSEWDVCGWWIENNEFGSHTLDAMRDAPHSTSQKK